MGTMRFSAPRQLREGDDINGFSCGLELIDGWLLRRATGARKAGTAVVYVSFASEGWLAGFYTLSAHSIERKSASGWIARNAPQQIPAILLGMLGVDVRCQGEGLGEQLLLDAVHRSMAAADAIGARALVVDPANNGARAFYQHHGFRDIAGVGRMYARL